MVVEYISWDWKEQPDLAKIAAAVRRLSGGRCDMREVDTGGDNYAILVSDGHLEQVAAQEWFDRYCEEL